MTSLQQKETFKKITRNTGQYDSILNRGDPTCLQVDRNGRKHNDSPLVHKRCFCGLNRDSTDCTQSVNYKHNYAIKAE